MSYINPTIRLTLLATLLSVSACSSMQNVTQNNLPAVSPVAPVAFETVLPVSTQPVSVWWKSQLQQEPVLIALIQQAEKNSPTLAQAVERIEQARISLASTQGSRELQLTGTASAQASGTLDGASVSARQIRAGVDASWEMDLWGKAKRGVEAAGVDVQGSELDWQQAKVSLSAEIARQYVAVRACQARAANYAAQLNSVQSTLKLDQLRLDAGRIARADMAATQVTLASTQGNIAQNKAACVANLAALAKLTAIDYQDVVQQMGAEKMVNNTPRIPQFMGTPQLAVPAEVLRQRPDVASAERRTLAAAIRLGQSKADLYPSFSLNGSIGASLIKLVTGGWVSGDSWSFGPSLRLPILDGGQTKLTIARNTSLYTESVAVYRNSVLNALAEVQTVLGALDQVQAQNTASNEVLTQNKLVLQSDEARFAAGRINQVDVERSRRAVFAAELSTIGSAENSANQWINLYKVLGGGWHS